MKLQAQFELVTETGTVYGTLNRSGLTPLLEGIEAAVTAHRGAEAIAGLTIIIAPMQEAQPC